MTTLNWLYLFLAVWAILYGISVFVTERTLVVISGIAAIATGVVALFLLFG